jgi:hypothetical protein
MYLLKLSFSQGFKYNCSDRIKNSVTMDEEGKEHGI